MARPTPRCQKTPCPRRSPWTLPCNCWPPGPQRNQRQSEKRPRRVARKQFQKHPKSPQKRRKRLPRKVRKRQRMITSNDDRCVQPAVTNELRDTRKARPKPYLVRRGSRSARVSFGEGLVRRGSRSARVSDPAETADQRSPAILETFGRAGWLAPKIDHNVCLKLSWIYRYPPKVVLSAACRMHFIDAKPSSRRSLSGGLKSPKPLFMLC
jgi:hypothetical protein